MAKGDGGPAAASRGREELPRWARSSSRRSAICTRPSSVQRTRPRRRSRLRRARGSTVARAAGGTSAAPLAARAMPVPGALPRAAPAPAAPARGARCNEWHYPPPWREGAPAGRFVAPSDACYARLLAACYEGFDLERTGARARADEPAVARLHAAFARARSARWTRAASSGRMRRSRWASARRARRPTSRAPRRRAGHDVQVPRPPHVRAPVGRERRARARAAARALPCAGRRARMRGGGRRRGGGRAARARARDVGEGNELLARARARAARRARRRAARAVRDGWRDGAAAAHDLAEASAVGSADFNIALVNRCAPRAESPRLKPDATFSGETDDRVTVSWHADSSLERTRRSRSTRARRRSTPRGGAGPARAKAAKAAAGASRCACARRRGPGLGK